MVRRQCSQSSRNEKVKNKNETLQSKIKNGIRNSVIGILKAPNIFHFALSFLFFYSQFFICRRNDLL